jgi:predicted O-linked N-acetylglucosamine transferase (SPINDLY family)
VSRQTGALLERIGEAELIAIDEDDYVRRTVALATDHARRDGLRRTLRERMAAALDPAAFAVEFFDQLRTLSRAPDGAG